MRTITASLVAASVGYLVAGLAFTGTLDRLAAAVFLALFVVVLPGFERFGPRDEPLESRGSSATQPWPLRRLHSLVTLVYVAVSLPSRYLACVT